MRWDLLRWMQGTNGAAATLTSYSIGPLGLRELDKGILLQSGVLARVRSRLHMALLGGVSLIAPVLIMTLKPSLVGSLVTTIVSTLVFAVAMVVFSTDASGKDVLASTAAYSAVMVVFLGTSLQAHV